MTININFKSDLMAPQTKGNMNCQFLSLVLFQGNKWVYFDTERNLFWIVCSFGFSSEISNLHLKKVFIYLLLLHWIATSTTKDGTFYPSYTQGWILTEEHFVICIVNWAIGNELQSGWQFKLPSFKQNNSKIELSKICKLVWQFKKILRPKIDCFRKKNDTQGGHKKFIDSMQHFSSLCSSQKWRT